MTERCQTKFTEKFENQNYVIYVGIVVTSFAVLYFYRFHFATIAFSYGLGCLACYYGLNSNVLDSLVSKIKCHPVTSRAEKEPEKAVDEDCATCGSRTCLRHDPQASSEPWVGLQIHKQLDQAIEDFYNAILDQFITSWYSKITLQPFFVDEIRYQLRYASACLLRRAIKINYSRFITERLIPCAIRHYTLCAAPDGAPLLASKMAVHPAAANRNAELKYLRSVTNAIMPYLLKNGELENPVFRVLVREIFAGWVLLSLTDTLADPYIINALVILATGDETMAQLPATPDYNVEFLSTFARHTDSVYAARARLLRADVERVVSEPSHLYAFMRHVAGGSGVAALKFYKDIKLFQTKILNPEISEAEQAELHKDACEIFAQYGALRSGVAVEVQRMLENGADVRRLQTSPVLYEAARETHAELEKIMLPRFLHSEEYYKLLIGSRIPTGYQKQNKKPQTRVTPSALKLDARLKTALRHQSIDGQVLDCFTNLEDSEDSVDNIDILKYLDSLAAEDVGEQDLSTCKVVLTDVDTRLQEPPRRGPVRIFSLAVHRARSDGARLWTARRSEHDFHLLRAKLLEFHGPRLLADLPLPSRRDNSPDETLRYKYEDFLQRVLQRNLLQTSELLRLFLTVDGDFALGVQAATLAANSSDLGNIYQSVTHKLRKEKGQHLESFLRNYLVSSDMERYQALKQGTHVEEALEVIEDEETEQIQLREHRRDIHSSVFRNNLDVEPSSVPRELRHQDRLVGFTQCFMYLLIRVVRVPLWLCRTAGGALAAARRALDAAAAAWLARTLRRVLAQPRLAHLIRLGHGMLFSKRPLPPRADAGQQRARARARLLRLPAAATLDAVFSLLQRPGLNKQLVYNLLDLCIIELFPELSAAHQSPNEPKS